MSGYTEELARKAHVRAEIERRHADTELVEAVDRLSVAIRPVHVVDAEGFSEPWAWDIYIAHLALRRTVGLPDIQPGQRP